MLIFPDLVSVSVENMKTPTRLTKSSISKFFPAPLKGKVRSNNSNKRSHSLSLSYGPSH